MNVALHLGQDFRRPYGAERTGMSKRQGDVAESCGDEFHCVQDGNHVARR